MPSYKKVFRLMEKNLHTAEFLHNAETLYSYEKHSRYPDFEKSAQFSVEALQKAGFSDVESIPVPCDGVTSYMDHTMPQAWDRACQAFRRRGRTPNADFKRIAVGITQQPVGRGNFRREDLQRASAGTVPGLRHGVVHV